MTLNTKAFELSRQQDVLIITPNGDSLSFRDVDIQREGTEIKAYVTEQEIRRIVFNLERSNYFGSLMIGIMHSIGQATKQLGGQMVLCNGSSEMEATLKIMKLDTLWPLFPTLPQALKVIRAWKV